MTFSFFGEQRFSGGEVNFYFETIRVFRLYFEFKVHKNTNHYELKRLRNTKCG